MRRFTKEKDQRPSSSESSRSILQTENWRRIERLLKQTVSDIYNQNTKKLSSTIYYLFTENILLKLQNKNFENALRNKQKKRQRGKPLQLQLQLFENRNAIFYSPKKIQQIQNLQAAKKQVIQLAKISKEKEKLYRKQIKKSKQYLIEEKKEIRKSNRELYIIKSEQKKFQKKEERLAKEADIQLQNNFKQARKGKNKPPKSSINENHEDTGHLTADIVKDAPIIQNRRGQQIRLPKRFRNN